MVDSEKSRNFASQMRTKEGLLAEWLGAGLQNRLLQFESGRDLKKAGSFMLSAFFIPKPKCL